MNDEPTLSLALVLKACLVGIAVYALIGLAIAVYGS